MENLKNAIQTRHSVRRFLDKKIPDDLLLHLNSEIDKINDISGVRFELVTDEPNAFNTLLAKYGKFSKVNNYILAIVKKDGDFSEQVGYYGELIVLKAQALGLNTCWAGISYSKNKCKVTLSPDEKIFIAIALGYGETQGVFHKSKPMQTFYTATEPCPDWFLEGVKSAMLAPTAINQQKFHFELSGNTVKLTHSFGPFSKTDKGIAKLHFEIGADKDNFVWRK